MYVYIYIYIYIYIQLSKIPHQMWNDHPFSQRNRTTQRTVGVEIGGKKEVEGGGGGQNLEVSNIGGGLHKIGS